MTSSSFPVTWARLGRLMAVGCDTGRPTKLVSVKTPLAALEEGRMGGRAEAASTTWSCVEAARAGEFRLLGGTVGGSASETA